jgi:hypothetical protein
MREAIFSFGDKGKYTGLELENIFESDQTGPLGYATVAKLLDLIGSPAKAAFASRGLSRLSIADFRKDYLLILQRDCVLKQCLENLVKALGRLDDKEVETLAAILSTEDAGFLRKGVHSLRQGENKSLIEILSPMLDEY